MNRFYLATITALIFFSTAHGADVSSDIQARSGGFDNSNGGYLEIGVGLNLIANREGAIITTVPFLAGAYRYRGFFLEALSPGINLTDKVVGGITLGFNVWRNEQWALDLLGASSRWRSGRTSSIDDANSQDPELDRKLLNRESFYNGAGFRLTGYYGNTIFQYRLIDDTHGGNGLTSSARIGHSRQVKNWNLHGFIGADYLSRETGQYWYGVTEQEATTSFASYDIGSSTFTYSAEIGATFPLRENLVFRSAARYTQFADAIAKSPVQEDEFVLRWNTSVSYVF